MGTSTFSAYAGPGSTIDVAAMPLTTAPHDALFDRLTRLAATTLRAPLALLSLTDAGQLWLESAYGLATPWPARRELPASYDICQHVVALGEPLVIGDARVHALVQENRAVTELGVVAYLGVPVASGNGAVVGCLAVIDTVPREWTGTDVSTLQDFAALAMVDAAQSEARFRLVCRATNDVIWDWKVGTGTITWSDAIHTTFGFEPGSVPDDFPWWIERLHPDDRDHVLAGLQEAINGTSQAWSAEYRFRRGDGSFASVLDRGYVQRDANGRAHRMVGSLLDLTERQRQEAHAREEQKMRAVGQLAGGIAHDFNNILTAILSSAELALAELRDGPAHAMVRADLLQIRSSAVRAADLTRQLLAFGQRQVLHPEVLDLNAVVTAFLPTLQQMVGGEVAVALHLDPALGLVRADRGQLEQAITHLAANARDAMPEGGTLTLETRNVELRDGRERPELPDGSYIRLTVADTGVGMDAATRAHLFEPFFTTKGPGRGAGLGLPTVYGVVTQSGGGLEVSSTPGVGSRFTVFLPRAEEVPHDARLDPAVGTIVSRGTKTVLVVEDEEAVRRILTRTLERAGYEVFEAGNGVEALALAGALPRPIDLLVTDLVMPGMGGRDVAESLRATRPELRVLFISGYDAGASQRGAPTANASFLAKPFTPAGFEQRVREMLEPPSHPMSGGVAR